jgi:hypothetical protein
MLLANGIETTGGAIIWIKDRKKANNSIKYLNDKNYNNNGGDNELRLNK